jgi:hypothetical protein
VGAVVVLVSGRQTEGGKNEDVLAPQVCCGPGGFGISDDPIRTVISLVTALRRVTSPHFPPAC